MQQRTEGILSVYVCVCVCARAYNVIFKMKLEDIAESCTLWTSANVSVCRLSLSLSLSVSVSVPLSLCLCLALTLSVSRSLSFFSHDCSVCSFLYILTREWTSYDVMLALHMTLCLHFLRRHAWTSYDVMLASKDS